MLLLFYEYLKIGLFAIGGGFATIPFLYHLSEIYPWFSSYELTNMIAISNITPGPIGINMATYSGMKTFGILGGITSTLGIITGPFIITLITIYFLEKFKKSELIKEIFKTLRPASCALLTYVLIGLISENIFPFLKINLKELFITVILFILYPLLKSKPSLIIILGGILGVVFNIF